MPTRSTFFIRTILQIRKRDSMPRSDPDILQYTGGLAGVKLDLDQRLIAALAAFIFIVAGPVLLCRIWQLFNSHLRHIYCNSTDETQQNYWSFDKSSSWPWLKRNLIYAPLFKKRHNREIQLSSAVNYGTIPGRLHTLLLVLYLLMNMIYICLLDYQNKDKAAIIAELRGRSGILATYNMILLALSLGRNNPLIPLLRVSFDTFNLFHRWIGRIVVVESLVHVIAWGTNSSQAKGVQATFTLLGSNTFFRFGTVASISMSLILIQSPSPIRHAFYETFLHLHKVLGFMTIVGVYVHLECANLPALPYIRLVVALWAFDHLCRFSRLAYLNFSFHGGWTSVTVEALPGEACKVTYQLPRNIIIRPGSHVYAYLPRISLWMSHPFSVAWTNIESEPPTGVQRRLEDNISVSEKGLEFVQPLERSRAPTSVSLIMVARTGMTRKLYEAALLSKEGRLRISGYLEGPYAGHDSLASYGTVVMFAGGAGITHHLIQIRHLIACAEARTVATRRLVLAWTMRDFEALNWVQPWMDEILQMKGRRDILRMVLYATKPKRPTDRVSSSSMVKLVSGRCNPGSLLDDVIPTRVGAMAVSVCGPGAFADEVRVAVRQRLNQGTIDLNEESFTW